MKIPEIYDYLVRARRDLRSTLEAAPAEVLSRSLLGGPRFHSIKDLLFHIADVEDGWINGDIRGGQMAQNAFPELRTINDANCAGVALETLFGYWRHVEEGTAEYLATLTEHELQRVVAVEDWPEKRLTVDGLLWHVMIHEMRHTAQICALLRTQGIKPPALDLLFYLP